MQAALVKNTYEKNCPWRCRIFNINVDHWHFHFHYIHPCSFWWLINAILKVGTYFKMAISKYTRIYIYSYFPLLCYIPYITHSTYILSPQREVSSYLLVIFQHASPISSPRTVSDSVSFISDSNQINISHGSLYSSSCHQLIYAWTLQLRRTWI